MHLEGHILIHRTPQQVWSFLGSVSNIEKWDRGVARTQTTTPTESQDPVGLEFDTFAGKDGTDWGRMSYRIAEIGPNSCKVELTNSDGNARFFRNASWTFKTQPDHRGTVLSCFADFTLRLRYIFLAPLLHAKKGAIGVDLESLKRTIEKD
jgi:hypothetical protein